MILLLLWVWGSYQGGRSVMESDGWNFTWKSFWWLCFSEEFKVKFLTFTHEESLVSSLTFNADHTGLFFTILPKQILASKLYSSAKEYTSSKEWVKLLLCSNVSRNLKLSLLVIGKSGKHHALKNCNLKSLQLHTCHKNQLGWDQIFLKISFSTHLLP